MALCDSHIKAALIRVQPRMWSHFCLTKTFIKEKNPFLTSRSQDRPHSFLGGHVNDKALLDKLNGSN